MFLSFDITLFFFLPLSLFNQVLSFSYCYKFFHFHIVTFFRISILCLCYAYKFFTLDFINSALIVNLHCAIVFFMFYIIFNQPGSRTMFVRVFLLSFILFLIYQFFLNL